MAIVDKLVNIAILGGLGLLAIEALKCRQQGEDILTCVVGSTVSNLSKTGDALTSGIIQETFVNRPQRLANTITCGLMGKKNVGTLFKPKIVDC